MYGRLFLRGDELGRGHEWFWKKDDVSGITEGVKVCLWVRDGLTANREKQIYLLSYQNLHLMKPLVWCNVNIIAAHAFYGEGVRYVQIVGGKDLGI